MVLLMWKYMGLFFRKNHLLRCLGWPSLLNWIGVLTLLLLLKLRPRKLELYFVLWSFSILRLLCISIKLPYTHVWNTVVTSELVSLIATWNCYPSYKTEYAGLLFLHLLLLLNPWLIVEMWSAQVFSLGITLSDNLQNWLNWFHFLFLKGGLLFTLIDCMIFLLQFLVALYLELTDIF